MPVLKESKLKTAFLISGGGTTIEAAIKACQERKLKGIQPVVVISSRSDAGGIAKAQSLGIETLVIARKEFPSVESFAAQLLRTFAKYQVDLVSQNGWLVHTPQEVIDRYPQMIVNQHSGPLDPGRIIDFGGQGMYGKRVVCARLAYCLLTGSDFWTEATTHLVTPEYDKGDLLKIEKLEFTDPSLRVTVAQLGTDQEIQQWLIERTQQLQASLLPLEHQNVIATLQMFAEKKVNGFRRLKPLIPQGNEEFAREAKRVAITLFPEG